MSKTATVWWNDGGHNQVIVADDYRIPDVTHGRWFYIEGINSQLLAAAEHVQSLSVCETPGNPTLQAASHA